MKQGYLSQYFEGVAVKRLRKVEIDKACSNQHEFNGDAGLKQLLGESGERKFDAKFLYLDDEDDAPVSESGFMTWYDAREGGRAGRKERRLYYSSTAILQCASVDDLLIIAECPGDRLLAIVAEKDTVIERQLLWLFGFSEQIHPRFSIRSEMETNQDRLGFAARVVLEQIGIEIQEQAPDYLEQMLAKFGTAYPKSELFSAFARNTLADISSLDAPDEALLAWMEREEILYRTLENHLLCEHLQNIGLTDIKDANPVIKRIQSDLQRRRSRAGLALENHMEQIFREHAITYTRGGKTEGRLKPDFIFPGIAHYHDATFPENSLTMLAAKTTCKDRWRQIRNEAKRISVKHLLTLGPAKCRWKKYNLCCPIACILPLHRHSRRG